ncbi:hypothetical protein FSB73_09445 [Arachidicoccus ginsenosidivorans]|uniref:Uncharacterized protein n=1 Tax=Arachidicoccus ginsenosidivorans TaxID=496057 RepID=A0A5B8VLL5_9BACT|nr:hypothetical protein [Arachidicoccus ginsenosidivorans]QEC71855.1 hypothetical protein FSB73_09445 [Arachidicoccus ginsenosidivorans]
MEYRYKSKVFKPFKMFVCCILIFVVAFLILVFVAVKFNATSIAVLGYCAITVIPFFYEKKVRARFMVDVNLIFKDDGLQVVFYNKNWCFYTKTLDFYWEDINAFKIYFTQSGYTNLDLYFKGRYFVKEISFVDKKEELAKNELSVFNLFLNYCYNYNATCDEEKKVKLRRGFLLTNWGKFALFSLLVLDLLFIILMLIYKPDKFPFSLISISIIITLFLKRENDKVTYERMKGYKPLNSMLEVVND